jgi:BirA family biotin operon repressor/biotin-[acetyl-CoA-carboxylase] ligase
MNVSPCTTVGVPTASAGTFSVSEREGWTLRHYPVVTSTNLVAAGLPVWTAVCARTQTAGRGRFQREWVSDEGGLWISAVVPLPAEPSARRCLPLGVGLAVCDALQSLGVEGLRLRWPNDLLVQGRKLAGLLVDRFAPDRAVAGIGLNISNQPECHQAALKNQTIRLADLLATAPTPLEAASVLLYHLRRLVTGMVAEGSTAVHPRINDWWGPPREVELDLDGTLRRGNFSGVDPEGRLVLTDAEGNTGFYEAHQVRHLTEL